jgi:hypothetical protein
MASKIYFLTLAKCDFLQHLGVSCKKIFLHGQTKYFGYLIFQEFFQEGQVAYLKFFYVQDHFQMKSRINRYNKRELKVGTPIVMVLLNPF